MTIVPGMVLFILPRSVLSVQLLLPFFPPSGVLFVLDVDYYKDGKISSSSSELHGSLVVMACIKLAPREQGSGWTSLEGGEL